AEPATTRQQRGSARHDGHPTEVTPLHANSPPCLLWFEVSYAPGLSSAFVGPQHNCSHDSKNPDKAWVVSLPLPLAHTQGSGRSSARRAAQAGGVPRFDRVSLGEYARDTILACR